MSKSPLRLSSSPAPAVAIFKTPAGKTIRSAPVVVLARLIASRSESLPSAGFTTSRPVLTVNVAGTARFSKGSSRNREWAQSRGRGWRFGVRGRASQLCSMCGRLRAKGVGIRGRRARVRPDDQLSAAGVRSTSGIVHFFGTTASVGSLRSNCAIWNCGTGIPKRRATDTRNRQRFWAGSGPINSAPKPGAGVGPEAINGAGGNAEYRGGLVHGQAGEVAKLHELCGLWVFCGQPGQRLVHSKDLVGPIGRGQRLFAELRAGPTAAAFPALLPPGVID